MNRIKELREKAGLKQTALARQLGVSQGALSGWETGKYNADYEHAKMMCGIFGVTLDYLLGHDETPAPEPSVPDDELWEIREQLRRRPEMRTLFSVTKDASSEDLKKAIKIIETLKGDDDE